MAEEINPNAESDTQSAFRSRIFEKLNKPDILLPTESNQPSQSEYVKKYQDTPLAVDKLLSKREKLSKSELKRGVDVDPSLDYIGAGAESVVIVDPTNSERVVAYVHNKESDQKNIDSLRAPLLFHTHRVWSTLFPHNFPKIEKSVGGHNARTVRSKVKDQADTSEVKYPMSEVYRKCKEHGVKPPVLDTTDANYKIGPDGGQYYVDLIPVVNLRPEDVFNLDNLETLMDEQELSEEDKQKVRSSEKRLREINVVRSAHFIKRRDSSVSEEKIEEYMQAYHLDESSKKAILKSLESLEKIKNSQ